MHINAVVPFCNAIAHYTVQKETGDIYLAILEKYEGTLAQAPPTQIVLFKGPRNWIGSTNQQELLNEIGRVIETASTSKTFPAKDRVI